MLTFLTTLLRQSETRSCAVGMADQILGPFIHVFVDEEPRRMRLSSPRAESARAVTGRLCPHSGRGEDFLSRQPFFFTETAVTPDRKVEKSFPRWEINRHVES